MSRPSTGAWTINDARSLSISKLISAGLIQRGCTKSTRWGWETVGNRKADIVIEATYTEQEQYLRLRYIVYLDGQEIDYDYNVRLIERPSNLGTGKVLFLECPVLKKACRKLYMAYDSCIFKCREAYRNRIYYPVQLSGKLSRSNDRYWQFKYQIDDLEKRGVTPFYAGKITRRAERLQRLYDKRAEMDALRWLLETYPCGLRRSMQRFKSEIEEARSKRR